MQTNAIQRSAQRPATFGEWLAGKAQDLTNWYNSRSDFFSLISGFDVKRKTAIRVNALACLVFLTAFLAVKYPLFSIFTAFSAAWMAYLLNKDEKKGGCDEKA